MRISDWSSDVCSSDLGGRNVSVGDSSAGVRGGWVRVDICSDSDRPWRLPADRKSVVEGKSVSVRVDLGGRRSIKKKNKITILSKMEPNFSCMKLSITTTTTSP